jgi:fumarylacetoacetate (FAA) hydrolase
MPQPLPEIRSIRDFMAFEAHVRTARGLRGLEMLPEWYEGPTFYFSNVATLVPDGGEVRKPAATERLDYELEVAVVIGRGGVDIAPDDAESHIAGLTIYNDWSARDVQRREMAIGLGPSKAKDFANTLGPHLVPLDELTAQRTGPGRWNLEMVARVNGVELSRGNLADMHWSFADLVAHASRDCPLVPGDVLGSGTVGTGCILELGPSVHRWLEAGDVVELEVEGLGMLRNTVVD